MADRRLVWASAGAMASTVFWSGYHIVNRVGFATHLTVGDLLAARYVVPAVVFLPLALRMGGFGRGLAGIPWRQALVLTASGGLTFGWFLASGLQFAPATQGGIFTSASAALFVVFLAWPILGEIPTAWRLAGVGLICAGDAFVAADTFGTVPDQWKGQLLMLGAAVSWAIYTVYARKWRVDAIRVTAAVSIISGVLFAPYYLFVMDKGIGQASAASIGFQTVYLGIFVGIGAVGFYTYALQIMGAQRAAMFLALIPVLTTLIAIPTLSEWPTQIEWIGVAVVSIGLPFALGWRPRLRRSAAPEKQASTG
jgi:drug/metabolite transporter (DMT)-like permease